jgi:formiminotetrahydrofolate cyclodeaminase
MSADKDYMSQPLGVFLTDLAARGPTPGGGSVGALVGALAAAQARMVIEYTLGRKQSAEHEPRLRQLLDELTRAGEMLTQLMAEDMAAYERMAASRKSDDEEERERGLATAVAVPMEMVVLAGAVVARLDEIKTFVNPNLFSDLQVAAILAYSSARSACTSVRINLNAMTDRKEASRLENQLDMLVGRAARHRNAVVHHQPPP